MCKYLGSQRHRKGHEIVALIKNSSLHIKAAVKENEDGTHGRLGDEASICMEGGYCEEPFAHMKESLSKADNEEHRRVTCMLCKLAKEASNAAVISPSTKKAEAENRTEGDLSISIMCEAAHLVHNTIVGTGYA